MTKARVSRRQLLRGAGGIALGLPLLEAMLPGSARAQSAPAPRRFVAMYFPDGTYQGTQLTGRRMGIWQPPALGPLSGQAVPPALEPLAANLGDFSVLSNIDNRSASYGSEGAAGGGHNRAMRSFLTASPALSAERVDINPSMDQIIADHFAKTETLRRHSLVLGTMAATSAPDSGLVTYMNHISYRNRTNVPLEKNPRRLFDALFSGVGSAAPVRDPALHASLLDFVKGDTTRLMQQLGTGDQRRVDEYLTSLRELERRVQLAEQTAAASCQVPTAPDATLDGEYRRTLPAAFTQEVEALVDIIVAAFRCDFTRTATLLLAGESHDINYGSVATMPYQGASMTPGRHIDSAHHVEDLEKIRRLVSIHQYELGFFKRLLDKLKAIPEPGGTMLDNTVVLYGCGLADGNAHNFSNIPLLVGGRAGGIVSGRHVGSAGGTPLANVQLQILQRMGLPLTSFGEGQGKSTGVVNLGA